MVFPALGPHPIVSRRFTVFFSSSPLGRPLLFAGLGNLRCSRVQFVLLSGDVIGTRPLASPTATAPPYLTGLPIGKRSVCRGLTWPHRQCGPRPMHTTTSSHGRSWAPKLHHCCPCSPHLLYSHPGRPLKPAKPQQPFFSAVSPAPRPSATGVIAAAPKKIRFQFFFFYKPLLSFTGNKRCSNQHNNF